MALKKITTYLMDWHLNNSDAFKDTMIGPLSKYIDFDLRDYNKISNNTPTSTQIYLMLPPKADNISKINNCIWVPMWDQAQGYSQKWWNSLPKNLKIVSFSKRVSKMSINAGLRTFEIKYYCNPRDFEPTNWDNGISVFYWNRVGLIGPDFINKISKSLNPKKIIFRPAIDPRINQNMHYDLPDRIGKTLVESIMPKNKEEYINFTKSTNIYIAPRKSEGIGMSFLEAMARGAAVIAFDAPTMNEYIEDGINGVLLPHENNNLISKIKNNLKISPVNNFLISSNQDWNKIKSYDFHELGDQARRDSQKGYEIWQGQLPELAKFIIND